MKVEAWGAEEQLSLEGAEAEEGESRDREEEAVR